MKNLYKEIIVVNRHYFRYVNKNQKCEYGKEASNCSNSPKMSLAIADILKKRIY
jgi:hypothetical protein